MKPSIVRISLLGLLAAAVASAPIPSNAQNTNKAPTEKKSVPPASAETSAKGGPFHGKLAALDKAAKTITVGKRTFHITSETKIKKSGKPALLEDAVVGETVSGYVKPGADGKLVATTLNLGPKASSTPTESAKAAPEKEKQPK